MHNTTGAEDGTYEEATTHWLSVNKFLTIMSFFSASYFALCHSQSTMEVMDLSMRGGWLSISFQPGHSHKIRSTTVTCSSFLPK